MSHQNADPANGQENLLLSKLKNFYLEIRFSYLHDADKTDEMLDLIKFLKEILESNESLEHNFKDNEPAFQYFITEFLKEIITNILSQYIVYGEDGDEIAVDLLYHIYKLFLKFHKNVKYAPMFEAIRSMLKDENASMPNFFKFCFEHNFSNQNQKIQNPKRNYNCSNFNHIFYKEYIDESKLSKKRFVIGDKVDILISYKNSRNPMDRNCWVRGVIDSINSDNFIYLVKCPELNNEIFSVQIDGEIEEEGKKTIDWDWRLNLKKYDVIDGYDRSRWYPSSIVAVNEKNKTYKVGFRLYPEYFKNLEDENDKYENYMKFWEGHQLQLDKKKEKYFGDKEDYDEELSFFSKRIQKFKSYTNTQSMYINTPIQYYAYGAKKSDMKNPMQKMNYELQYDEFDMSFNDDAIKYEINGKKNYIIGKSNKFSYYYALFFKKLADDNAFEDFIEIIKNNPNVEEIYTVLHTIYCAMPYLHKQYLIENLDNFKNAMLNFINNLDTKEIRNLSKNLIEIFTQFMKGINTMLMTPSGSSDEKDEKTNNILSSINEISISLSIKLLKTSIFDKRMQGIKSLDEFIELNKNNEETMKILINLIQKNDIIKEIFGPNYHSQIISKSDQILSLLLKNNIIKEEEINLIWDCAQRGDLEAKSIIMKLLSDLAPNLNETFINILLESTINTLNKDKMNEKEIDFIFNLSIHGDNENNKNKCCEYLYQCILKLDINNDEIKNSPILTKLLIFSQNDEKYLTKILSMCKNDLEQNNSSLAVLQILSKILNQYTKSLLDITYLKKPVEEFVKDENLLKLYKDNFMLYIARIKEQIKSKPGLINYDNEIVDNYTHTINITKRIDFLNDWISLIYPSFDFVPFLKEILLINPVSKNDENIFYEFMQKFISENTSVENKIRTEKKEKIKSQLFKFFIDNEQSNMSYSEFKLFISIFLLMNSTNICYLVDKDDNYDIKLSCKDIEEIKDLDKLWSIIFQLKEEKVLNKAISIMFNIYRSIDQLDKLLNKCKELINTENTNSEIINKCFKLLKIIILESEKNIITKTKSHFNLTKNCYIFTQFKMTPKYPQYYYYTGDNGESAKTEIIYGNSTINEIKELLIERGKIPLKYIEISLSKEYMNNIKNNKDDKNDKHDENELILDDSYNNRSILEILNNNYNQKLSIDKIFIFHSKSIEKAALLIDDKLNPKFEKILKEWFAEFTNGEEKMDVNGCSRFISKVTGTTQITNLNDERITNFFKEYDPENTGYITEEKFLEFYYNSAKSERDNTVWDNLKAMGVREDLHKKDEKEDIPYGINSNLPRYTLGNDKNFVENLFSLFNKFDNKNEIYEFLFFLSTNEYIYNDILNNLNKENENNFEKIFDEKNKKLFSLYGLIIIESILQDINIEYTNFKYLFDKYSENKNGTSELELQISSKKYENFDDIDIELKKNFLKNFILSKNFEKLLNYMNKLLLEYNFDNKDNDNFILNLCCEKSIKVINIIYNAINEKKSENQNNKINEGILLFDYNNLYDFIKSENDIKETIENINYFEYTKNIIKFIYELNNKLNKDDNNENIELNPINNLLKNSFNLLITLVSNNNKLISEIDTNIDTKKIFENLIKSIFNTKKEYYKSFYINCLLNSVKNSKDNFNENKFFNLLFELSNDIIFNQIMKNDYINNDNNYNSKSSSILFDLFSILTLKLEDNIGNEFLFKIYEFLFEKLQNFEKNKNIPVEIFVGLLNILIKRIKNNENIKNIIINKDIDGITLLDLICDKIYPKEQENKDVFNEQNLDKNNNNNNNESLFINLEEINNSAKPEIDKEMPVEIKEICTQYLIESFQKTFSEKLFKKILLILKLFYSQKADEKEEENAKQHQAPPSFKKYGHVGLKNLGCICYMNSILQQVYMVPTFRYAILGSGAEETNISTEDDSLHQLQIMYSFLTLSEKSDYNPKSFCMAFKDFDGNPINPMIQQDSQEFFNNFFDKMENLLKKTKYKYIINDVFTGRTCSSVICENCKNVSNRFEDFYNLTLEVKNINNLNDSLHKLITPEKIDDFKCDNCNQKVTINKRTSLSDLPNVLVFHLKRFYMNYEIERTEKINSRFEFPFNINMKEFCIEDLEILGKKFENDDIYIKDDSYYEYELKGINIHMGSADGGHYFSVINIERDGEGNILIEKKLDEKNNNKWLKFNDSDISVFDINEIEKECFGGASKGYLYNYENYQNAYMLIYERRKKTPIRIKYDEDEVKNIFDENILKNNNIRINTDNKSKIKKEYNLAKKENKINEKNLYEKIFNDEDKKEYYKYIPFYSIEKCVPRYIYNQVIEKNIKLEKFKNKENEGSNHKNDFNKILMDNISSSDFNIINYSIEIQSDLLNMLFNELFPKDKYLYDEEKKSHNAKSKIILEKIFLPLIKTYSDDDNEKNTKIILMIYTLFTQKEKLLRIFVNDISAIFYPENIKYFCDILKILLSFYSTKNTNKYLSLIELFLSLIQEIDTAETYPKNKNADEIVPLYYIYQILYDLCIKDNSVVTKLMNQNCISTLLGKLTSDNKKCREVILEILFYLIKNLDEYDDKLFDVEPKEKKNNYFHEKIYLIKNISPIFIELLFNEKIELLIVLLKLLQNNELNFSNQFNSQNLYELFIYSTNNNKIKEMNQVLLGLLGINDDCTLSRLNYILGYPTMIIKDIKDDYLSRIKKNELYEEEKKEEDDLKDNKNNNKYKWPLFGERLIMEENNNNTSDNNIDYKLKKHIYKYVSFFHEHDDFCLLGRIMPEIDDKGEIINKISKSIDDKERKKLIYDLLKLMLIGKGNYTVFKYIYLLPARCIYYDNLYEEMIDILEQENIDNKNIVYDLQEIKNNAEICIKKVKYEINKQIKKIKKDNENEDLIDCLLPEKMQKYYIKIESVEKFLGANPEFIPGDVVKEKILILTHSNGIYLMRLEYVTNYKTKSEIRNYLLNKKKNNIEEKEQKVEELKEEDKIIPKDENKEKEFNINNNNSEEEGEDEDSCTKIDLSEISNIVDNKAFLLEVIRKYLMGRGRKQLIITDSTNKNNKYISSFVRFIILNLSTQKGTMEIVISYKDIPKEVKYNYYYQPTFWDFLKDEGTTNFCNINRLTTDIPFLKKDYIGININIKKFKENE